MRALIRLPVEAGSGIPPKATTSSLVTPRAETREGSTKDTGGGDCGLPCPSDKCPKPRPIATGTLGGGSDLLTAGEEGGVRAACPIPPSPNATKGAGAATGEGDAVLLTAGEERGVRAACPRSPSPDATEGAGAAATPEGERAEAACLGPPLPAPAGPVMTSDADVGKVKGEVGVRAACPKPPSPNATEGTAAAAMPEGERAEAACLGPPLPAPAGPVMTSDADDGIVKGEVGATCPDPPPPRPTSAAAVIAGTSASGGATTDSPSPEPTKVLTDDVRTEHPASAPPASSNSNKGSDCSNSSSESTRSLQSLGGAEAGSKDPNRNEVIGTDGEGAVSTPVPSPV
nr:predicted GPI-anchored protein 58 [Aegilops tauschii subsp. strangulata]